MKAGAALGLLAGLGALNALGGGRNGTGKRFTGLMDMLDGGGAGASGDRFEGGGFLSMLGNLFAKPLEAQDNVERIAADANATRAVTKTLEDMAKGGALTSRLDGKDGLLSPTPQFSSRLDGKDGDISAGLTSAPAPSYATMPMGEAGRGMTSTAPSYATMPMGEAGRGMPSAIPTPSGLIAPQADTAPSMINPTDPLIGGTRNPSAYRPTNFSYAEMRPIIDPRGASPMSYEEYVPYISDLYRKEYGTSPTEQQLLSAYQVYTQGMGINPATMAIEDGSVSRSPTPSAPTSPSAPAAPQSQPKSVSDLPYADQIVAARQAVMREQITPDMLESVFGVDFAREVMSGIQMMGGKTAVPNIPLGPLSIQRMHQTMPITRFD